MDLDDLDDLAGRLQRWAASELLPDARVAHLSPMPGNAGLSFGFDIVDLAGTVHRRLVVRFAPPGVRRSGNTDVLRQVPLLRALEKNGIPVAPLVWSTGDPAWFGTDAVVQERLAAKPLNLWGDGPAVDPEPFLRRAVDTLAAIHALDWQHALAGWDEPRSIADEVAFWDRLLAKHLDPSWTEAGRRLAEALAATDPGNHRIGLFHGDYHTNNILFDEHDGSVAAVIDWEIAGIGATGLDLGWLALMTDPSCWHPSQERRINADPRQLRDWYEATAGVEVPHADWYQALACYRFGAIAGFNVRLHRTGRRPDPLYEDMAHSVPVFFSRGLELVRG